MRTPKILFTTHHTAFVNEGGGEIWLRQILGFLRSNNIYADLFNAETKNLIEYDLIVHFGTNLDGFHLLQKCKSFRKPIILFPNLWINEPATIDFNIIKHFFKFADHYVFNSEAELNNCTNHFSISHLNISILPIGIDQRFFSINSDLGVAFKKLYRLERYLLWIGSICKEQGQLELIQAFQNFRIPIVFIGQSNDEIYMSKCIENSRDNIFIRSTSHDSNLILGALNGCNLYLELKNGPAGLSALEAGAAGKKVVLNENSWTTELFEGYAKSFRYPYDYNKISSYINSILESNMSYDISLSSHLAVKHDFNDSCNQLINLFRKFIVL